MKTFEIIKFTAELITSISAALIVLERACKIVSPFIKKAKIAIKLFFIGTTDTNGKKVKLFKAFKVNREYQEQFKNVLKSLVPDSEMKEMLVLNEKELLKALAESRIFSRISLRMQ